MGYYILKKVFALICLFFVGCASVIHGVNQEVAVYTEPPGARIKVSDGSLWESPAQIKLKRKKSYILEISKLGYETEHRYVDHKVSGWVMGNVLVGGLPGWVVDAIYGGQYKLNPSVFYVNLESISHSE